MLHKASSHLLFLNMLVALWIIFLQTPHNYKYIVSTSKLRSCTVLGCHFEAHFLKNQTTTKKPNLTKKKNTKRTNKNKKEGFCDVQIQESSRSKCSWRLKVAVILLLRPHWISQMFLTLLKRTKELISIELYVQPSVRKKA